MAHTVKTQALAAYIESRKATFAGAPVTLTRLAQMWKLPVDVKQDTVSEDALSRIAQYLKMPLVDLVAAVAKMASSAKPAVPPPPAPKPVPAPIAAPTKPAPAAAPPPTPVPMPAPTPTPAPGPAESTAVMSHAQLADLTTASRKSEPVIATPSAEPSADPEISISFDDVEATPPPTTAATATEASTKPSGKPSKGKSDKKKQR